MTRSYKKRIQIRFREADPARILYFANLLDLAHDCFEDFIQAAGFAWTEWFKDPASLVPIRHAECDYQKPFLPGEFYDVDVIVAGFGETSMRMKYIFRQEDRVHAIVHMVHAFLDPKTRQKKRVPDEIRQRLSPYMEAKAP